MRPTILCLVAFVDAVAQSPQPALLEPGSLPADGLVMYFDFRNIDVVNGLQVRDASVNNYVANFGSSYNSQNPASVMTGLQTFGGNGVSTVRLSDSSLNFQSNLSTCVVFKLSSTNSNIRLISADDWQSPWEGWGVGIGVTSAHKLQFYSSTGSWKTATSNYDDGNWHTGCVVLNGSTVNFFKDGVADGSPGGSGTPNSWPGVTSIAGKCGNASCGSTMNGVDGLQIAAVAIWNRALGTGPNGDIALASRTLAEAPYITRPSVPTDLPWPPVITTVVDNGQARVPPMGYNTWDGYGATLTESQAKAAADALVSSGLQASGYNLYVIDDVAKYRDASGVLHFSTTSFPDDADGTYAYIRGDGFRTGFYTSPGTVTCGGNPGSYRHEV